MPKVKYEFIRNHVLLDDAMTVMLVITMYLVQLWSTLFYSLSRNKIGDDGATALAHALAANRSLKTLM